VLGAGYTATDTTRVVAPLAARVIDLGNSIYALTIRALSQVFAPSPLPRELRLALSASTTTLMAALGRVADVATKLPIDPARPGLTAAPNFELPSSIGQLVQQSAAAILGERSSELAAAAHRLAQDVPLAGVANDLELLARRFDALHVRFESHIGEAVDRVAAIAAPAPASSAPPAELPGADAASETPDVACTADITLRFDGRRCIHSRHCVLEAPTVFLANTRGAWIHPESTTVEHCVRVAHNCPSGAISYERHDGGPQETAPAVNVLRLRENGPYAIHARIELPTGVEFRATLCRCGQSKRKPYCDGSHKATGFVASGEPETRPSEPLPERGGALSVTPLNDGPLLLAGNVEICAGTGRTVLRTSQARLCRCGGSQNKPFCDGTHARIGFRSDE
jgi:CDGSH-type Zn-finger protein/uncharacterized Fe-S cluster protein YjdI